MATEQARANGGRWVTGKILGDSEGGFEFEGFNQPLRASTNGEGMQARYVVLDYSGMGNSLYSTHVLEAAHTDSRTGGVKYLGRSIHFAGSTPYKDSTCWFSPYFACAGGESTNRIITGNINKSWNDVNCWILVHSNCFLFPKAWTQSRSSFFSFCSFHWLELELTSSFVSSMYRRIPKHDILFSAVLCDL